MEQRKLGRTGLSIAPLVFGGNVFGWTVDEKTSFDLLDAFVDGGLNAIDTADVYSAWHPGNKGGESETIIGRWLAQQPGRRDKVVLFTKVGMDMGGEGKKGLSAKWIIEEVENSLRRLQTDVIDLYFSHKPDGTPHDETLAAHNTLLKAGKIRSIGASNFDAGMMTAALAAAQAKGMTDYQVLQPEYNLYDRHSFDGKLREFCLAHDVGVVCFYSLAMGFLSGKYRKASDFEGSIRGGRATKYLDARGETILAALDQVAAAHSATPAEVALAWLIQRQGITAPIASATSRAQVASLIKSASLKLSAADVAALDNASEPVAVAA